MRCDMKANAITWVSVLLITLAGWGGCEKSASISPACDTISGEPTALDDVDDGIEVTYEGLDGPADPWADDGDVTAEVIPLDEGEVLEVYDQDDPQEQVESVDEPLVEPDAEDDEQIEVVEVPEVIEVVQVVEVPAPEIVVSPTVVITEEIYVYNAPTPRPVVVIVNNRHDRRRRVAVRPRRFGNKPVLRRPARPSPSPRRRPLVVKRPLVPRRKPAVRNVQRDRRPPRRAKATLASVAKPGKPDKPRAAARARRTHQRKAALALAERQAKERKQAARQAQAKARRKAAARRAAAQKRNKASAARRR